MRGVDFKRKDSSFKSIREEKKQVDLKRLNWDRITYFIILFVALFFLGRFIFLKYYFIKADGQVLCKSIDIQNLDDSRILNFFVEEGEDVCKGDTLFVYLNDDDNVNSNGVGSDVNLTIGTGVKGTNWIEKEISDLEQEIALNRNSFEQANNQLKKAKEELNVARQEVMLDALPKSVYVSIESKIQDLKDELNLLDGKHKILLNTLNKLKAQLSSLNSDATQFNSTSSVGNRGDDNLIKAFLAPMDGTVTRIYKQDQEVAIKSEVIMSIHKNEKLFIKAFFDQEDVSELKEYDVVEIEFPDKSISLGKINRFYFATYRLPEEFQKKYEPTTRSLSVDIVPLNKEQLRKWKQFYKMSVVVRKKRF